MNRTSDHIMNDYFYGFALLVLDRRLYYHHRGGTRRGGAAFLTTHVLVKRIKFEFCYIYHNCF